MGRARDDRRGTHVVTRVAKKRQTQGWTAVNDTDDVVSEVYLASILNHRSCRRALTAALELSVEGCFQAYDEGGRVMSLEGWLLRELGENLLANKDESETRSAGFSPAGMLRKVLRDSSSFLRVDGEEATQLIAQTLKERFTTRRQMLRDEKICITWRGVATNLSTMSRVQTVDVSTVLACPDDDFAALVTALNAIGDHENVSSRPSAGKANGVFLANAGWSSRGSHLGGHPP